MLKKIIAVITGAVMIACFGALTLGCDAPSGTNSTVDKISDDSSTLGEMYKINYVTICGDKRGDLLKDLNYMLIEGGNYPTSYRGGETVYIDKCRDEKYIDDYTVIGFFKNEECTLPFDGVITSRQTGDVTIYIKIKRNWTDRY